MTIKQELLRLIEKWLTKIKRALEIPPRRDWRIYDNPIFGDFGPKNISTTETLKLSDCTLVINSEELKKFQKEISKESDKIFQEMAKAQQEMIDEIQKIFPPLQLPPKPQPDPKESLRNHIRKNRNWQW